MKNKKLDWELWLRAGRDPWELAYEVLSDGTGELDDDDERHLAAVEGLAGAELLAWIVRRGPAPRELPEGVPSTTQLVARFVDTWTPHEGFYPHADAQLPTIYGLPISSIDPFVWMELVRAMLERHLKEPRQRVDAIRSLPLPCELFRSLRAKDSMGRIPPEVVRTREPWLHPAAAILERLMPVYRDPKACREALLEVARESVATGDLLPLWALERLGLIGEVTDPRSVLPVRVWFGIEGPELSEEQRQTLAYARWPVSLALRWPGGGARGWVRDQILVALSAGARRDDVERLLLGAPEGQEPGVGGVDRELTPALSAWLADRGELDCLMRASVDAGTPLPSAWMTLIRDLRDGLEGAWTRALDWGDWMLAAFSDGACPLEWYLDRNPRSFALDGVEICGAIAALDWIVWRAPLAGVDLARLEAMMSRVDALRSSPPVNYYGRVARFPFSSVTSERWIRQADLPPTSAGRAKLVAMLKGEPSLLRVPDAERALDRLGALTEDELPAVDERLWRYSPDGIDAVTCARYQRVGGAIATRRMLAALRAQLFLYLHRFDGSQPFLKACARAADEETRTQVAEHLATADLEWLASRGAEVASLFSVPFDLVAVARGRIEGAVERFEVLPDLPGVDELLLARMEWLCAHGEPAWSAALTRRPSSSVVGRDDEEEDHAKRCHEVVDRYVVALAARLVPSGIDRARVAVCLRDRARKASDEHAAALFDALAATGARRKELLELACARLLNSGDESWRAATTTLPVVIGTRMTSRTAWDEDGVALVQSLLDRHADSLGRACDLAHQVCREGQVGSPARSKTDPGSTLDAMLLAFARAFAARAQDAMERGDVPVASRALRAIAELDAPSRARPLMVPLRRLAKGTERLEAAVEVCERLLRSDADRAPTVGGIARALAEFRPRQR